VTTQLDWEVELAFVIGRGGKNIKPENAMEYVWGYTVANDVSARDVQVAHGGQFFKGKSLDGTYPMGPWIVTADEILDPNALSLRCRVNGVTKQNSNTSEFIFKIPELINWLSRGMTLLPGDVISTGTPSGVGLGHKPPEYLKVGDVVECEVEGIGTIRNRVVQA
jgi:2-keto-4-pentenoate hydratase/2-oxohepta-3-ene-1,7-dioic acid hydratase in catechol pathway